MTQAQKIIKYLAIGLAVLIIVGIASGIYHTGAAIISIFEHDDSHNDNIGELTEISLYSDELPSRLDVEIAASEMTLKLGDTLKIETNNSYISCSVKRDTLSITEESFGIFHQGNVNSAIVITLPRELVFDEVDIDAGAGRLIIEGLSANELSLDLGAGETVIDSLFVSGEADINGGAGRIEIKTAEIGHIDVSHGFGELDITALIKNGGEFDCGVGNVDLSLMGGKADYSVNVERGLGKITVDGKTAKNDSTYGTGSSRVEINGGVGGISISFSK